MMNHDDESKAIASIIISIIVAIALNQPLGLISTEMVFRGSYHFFNPFLRGDGCNTVPYLVERQKLFGLVKTTHKRYRHIDAYTKHIWALSS